MATNKDYYEECKKNLEEIDKLLKESEKFTSWNNLFDSFSQDDKRQKTKLRKQKQEQIIEQKGYIIKQSL